MKSVNIKQALPIIGIGILGYLHEFMISERPELLPTILFGLLLVIGVTRFFSRK